MVCVFKHLYCSAQLSMSSMEKRYRNKIIIIIIKYLYLSHKVIGIFHEYKVFASSTQSICTSHTAYFTLNIHPFTQQYFMEIIQHLANP